MNYTTLTLALLFTSFFSALGGFLLFTSKANMDRITPFLISLSAGTIFGGVFIHLIFKLSNKIGYTRYVGLMILAGMGLSLVLEKVIHWHCHHADLHHEPTPYVLAAGDAVHNVLDGVLVATSFMVSGPTGVAATIAVIAHKIPKELGDFGVMVNGGFTRKKALAANILVGLFMFVGAGIVVGLSSISTAIEVYLLPFVIGNFVFIAGSDLLPEFKADDRWIAHLVMFSVGVGIMYAIPYIKAMV